MIISTLFFTKKQCKDTLFLTYNMNVLTLFLVFLENKTAFAQGFGSKISGVQFFCIFVAEYVK